jgi:hypothetical protein
MIDERRMISLVGGKLIDASVHMHLVHHVPVSNR